MIVFALLYAVTLLALGAVVASVSIRVPRDPWSEIGTTFIIVGLNVLALVMALYAWGVGR